MSSQYDRDSTPELVRDMGGNVREWTAGLYEQKAYCDDTDLSVFDEACGDDIACRGALCDDTLNCVRNCTAERDAFCLAPPINAVFVDPQGPPGNVTPDSSVAVRGASFDVSIVCRAEASHRSSFRAGSSHTQVGFRCAQDLKSGGQSCLSDVDCASADCSGGLCTREELPISCADL